MLFVLLNFANENIKTKQNCFVSEQHTAAFHFLMHVLNELATRSFCGGNNGIAVRLPLSLVVEVFCAVSGETLP